MEKFFCPNISCNNRPETRSSWRIGTLACASALPVWILDWKRPLALPLMKMSMLSLSFQVGAKRRSKMQFQFHHHHHKGRSKPISNQFNPFQWQTVPTCYCQIGTTLIGCWIHGQCKLSQLVFRCNRDNQIFVVIALPSTLGNRLGGLRMIPTAMFGSAGGTRNLPFVSTYAYSTQFHVPLS